MNKKVVVTGGLGFIGSNLIELLLEKKFKVINIDKATYSANFYNIKEFKKNKNYFFYKVDINNKKRILNILKKHKPDGLFNLAAETHVDRSIDSPDVFIKSNILGVFNLLEAIKKYKKIKKKFKMVHISTDEVYGDILNPNKRSKENDSYKPSSPYSASKASADHLIMSYVRTFKLPIVISNCCNNYGPRQHPEKLIPKVIFNIQNNLNIPVYAKGLNSREWIYVKDHSAALLTIFKKGIIGESYNVGSGKNLKNLEIVKTLLNLFKKEKKTIKSKIQFVKDRPGHDFRYALNSTKIRKKLGWKNNISIQKGLSNTINWYLNNKNYYKNNNRKNFIKRFGILK